MAKTRVSLVMLRGTEAESCQLAAVADALTRSHGQASAWVKRLGRFLSNPRISDELLTHGWIRWLSDRFASPRWVILVDETKLSDHLSVWRTDSGRFHYCGVVTIPSVILPKGRWLSLENC